MVRHDAGPALGRETMHSPRIIYAQFQNVSGNDIGQFRDMSRQVVVWPAELKTGNLIYPYDQAAR